MKTLFDIRSDREPGNEHVLLLEVGKDYCSYVYWHRPGNTIDCIRFYSFEETEADKSMRNILEQCKEVAFESVIVCAAFPQALLVPVNYFTNDYTALDTIYQQPLQVYHHDDITEWQMVNMYSLPRTIDLILEAGFPSITYFHAYTPTIKVYNGFISDNQLSVCFTPLQFSVLLKKDSMIHLAQTYSYTTPLDVVYYLLKICYEFEIEESTLDVILSGLVEKDSALFAELQHYFTNLHFARLPEITLPETDLPPHFFTSLYNLVACVS